MATTPEAKVKKKVAALLKGYGVYYFYPVTGGYGSSGVPDIIACWQGRFIAIECKAGSNQPTALQMKNLQDIRKAGGYTMVVNEEALPELEQWFVERDLRTERP
jgi:Holliday junction resolvase